MYVYTYRLGKECKQVHSLEFLDGKSHPLAKPQLPKDGVVKVTSTSVLIKL